MLLLLLDFYSLLIGAGAFLSREDSRYDS